jgi:hypothetical protein
MVHISAQAPNDSGFTVLPICTGLLLQYLKMVITVYFHTLWNSFISHYLFGANISNGMCDINFTGLAAVYIAIADFTVN